MQIEQVAAELGDALDDLRGRRAEREAERRQLLGFVAGFLATVAVYTCWRLLATLMGAQ